MHELLLRFKPGSSRWGLMMVASIVWGFAGGMLLKRGYGYEMDTAPQHPLLLAAGIVGGILFFRLLFQRISARHISRILALKPDRPCLFSFLSWRSYFLMSIMIGAGIGLRTSGIVPQRDLGAFYVAMGLPLVASSAKFIYRGITLAWEQKHAGLSKKETDQPMAARR